MAERKAARESATAKGVPLVGLTGPMGAGKSTALKLLAELGAKVLSTDKVVHQLYGCARLQEKLVARWGEGVVVDGVVSRDEVARRVFADEEERRWLERTIWPLVGERVAVWYALAREEQPPPRAAVVETPLLFESGMDKSCDATVAILADPQLIAQRTAQRTHLARAERNARQLPAEEKARRATFVVSNNGDLEELRAALAKVLQQLDP